MRAPIWTSWICLLGCLAGCVEYDHVADVDPDGLNEGPPDPATVPEGYALDVFEGGGQTTVDVIVFGDTSGSMEEELRTLGQTIQPFVERLATHVDDWQLAAVTSGNGCTASGVLTPDTPSFAARFADALVQPIGDDDEAEQGLRNVTRAMENSGRGGCSEGLIRGGLLQILFVTDENEESPGYEDAPDYWLDYVEQIGRIHGDPSRVKMSAVAGPTPNGCRGADPGFGYDGPVAATGGEYLSICDDWANELDIIADTVTLRTAFPLADTPVPGTIRVWLNERELDDSEFSYDLQTNVVTLLSPAGGDDIVSIEYQIAQ